MYEAFLAAKARKFLDGEEYEAVRDYPDLTQGFVHLSLARKYAGQKLPEHLRELFVEMVRIRIGEMIINGEAIPSPYLKKDSLYRFLEADGHEIPRSV